MTYYLPETEFSRVTPELLCRIMDDLPPHEEGDYSVEVATEDLAELLRATGREVVIGYQNWGSDDDKA